MNKQKIILWDFDGTLGYRTGRWSGALAEVLDQQLTSTRFAGEDFRPFLRTGFPWHHPEADHLHLTTAELWWTEIERVLAQAYIGVGFSPGEAAHYAKLAHRKYLEPAGWSLFDDVQPTLHQLSAMGWSHVILSNHVPELAQLVEAIGLRAYVAHVFTSALIGYEKPHPEAFRLPLAALGSPEQVWMIGDNDKADIEGAEAVGIPAILVRSTSSIAKRCCQNLQDVIQYLA